VVSSLPTCTNSKCPESVEEHNDVAIPKPNKPLEDPKSFDYCASDFYDVPFTSLQET